MSPDDPQRNDRKELFRRRISEIESRRIRERHREYKQLWFGLGTMGIIGWSVSIPTLAFLALGIAESFYGTFEADEDYLWLVRDLNNDTDTDDDWEEIEFERL